MNIREIYRVYGQHVCGYADMVVLQVGDETIKLKRLKDGEVVEVDRSFFEKLPKRQMDESVAYGNDCPKGVCEF